MTMCEGRYDPEPGWLAPYLCTREAPHQGNHRVVINGRVLAVWSQDGVFAHLPAGTRDTTPVRC